MERESRAERKRVAIRASGARSLERANAATNRGGVRRAPRPPSDRLLRENRRGVGWCAWALPLLAAIVVMLSAPRPASAQSAPSLVVIVTSDPAAPSSQRVAKDLRGLGLDVLVLKATPENSSGRASLERSARSVGAIAALRLIESGEGMEVWVADRVTGKTVIRQLVNPPGAQPEPDDVALGAIELLRASLMELHAPTPSRGEMEAPPVVREIVYPCPPEQPPQPYVPTLALSAGPGVELGLRALGPSLHVALSGWARLAGPLGARVFVSMPLVAERSTVPEGHVQLNADVMGAGLSYETRFWGGALVPQVTAGFAAAHVITWGRASAPLVSSFEQGWYAGGYAQIGAALRVVRGIRLRLDLTGLLFPSAPEIDIVRRTVGTWGGPAGLASFAWEVVWSP